MNTQLPLDPSAVVSQLLAVIHLVKLVQEQPHGHEGADRKQEPGGDSVVAVCLDNQEADTGALGDRQESEELRSKSVIAAWLRQTSP